MALSLLDEIRKKSEKPHPSHSTCIRILEKTCSLRFSVWRTFATHQRNTEIPTGRTTEGNVGRHCEVPTLFNY